MRLAGIAAAVTVFGIVLAAGTAPARACEAAVHLKYNEPVSLEGALQSGTGHHEAQGDFTFVYLALDREICVDASKGEPGTEAPVGRIQLAGEAIMNELPVGKRVLAKGKLFPAHTMWHIEPVLMDASRIELK